MAQKALVIVSRKGELLEVVLRRMVSNDLLGGKEGFVWGTRGRESYTNHLQNELHQRYFSKILTTLLEYLPLTASGSLYIVSHKKCIFLNML